MTIYGKPTNENSIVFKVLDALKGAYLMRFNALEMTDATDLTKHIGDTELTKTLAKYEHVRWEYFPLVKEKRMDEVLYNKYYTDPAAALTKEQEGLVKKMTDLTTAGKYDEAGKVGDRMMQISGLASDGKYNWDIAIKCLDEMALNAYPTKIMIDRPPSEWELPPVPK